MDQAVFDEAHCVHTAKRRFRWGRRNEAKDAGRDNASVDTETEAISDVEEDAVLEGGGRKQNFECTETGDFALEKHYPRDLEC